MNIRTISDTVIIFCAVGIAGTCTFGESNIYHYGPTLDPHVINPDETPALMRCFGKLKVYPLNA